MSVTAPKWPHTGTHRVGKRYRRYDDLPAGYDIVCERDGEPFCEAFGYRLGTGFVFVYVPDRSYTFTATPRMLNRQSRPLTWYEGLFLLDRFLEGWMSAPQNPVGTVDY